jgi:hypothetical protein
MLHHVHERGHEPEGRQYGEHQSDENQDGHEVEAFVAWQCRSPQ